MRPARSILDASFRYVPSFSTSVASVAASTASYFVQHLRRKGVRIYACLLLLI